MKKNLLSTLAFVSMAGSTFAQLPVSTAPENKKAILEEFTGIYCGYCPDGHATANAIKAADPNNVVLINIHSGPFAVVAAGEPDLTTPEGNAIDALAQAGNVGYPAGTMNRNLFAGSSQLADGRNFWGGWANTIKTQAAYCNVALQGTIDVVTRLLTVQVEVYYTANAPVTTNSITVALQEDSVLGPQHNYGTPLYNASNYNADGTYNHNHVLRKFLTGTYGQSISNTTMGTTFTQTYTYTIPANYGGSGRTNPCFLGNLKLSAFVSETNENTINGNNGPITLTGFTNVTDIGPNSLKSDANGCLGNNYNSQFKFNNYGSSAVTSANFNYLVNGVLAGTYAWSGYVKPYGYCETIVAPAMNLPLSPYTTNNFSITVSNVNGIADQNAANNSIGKVIAHAPVASSVTLEFDFNQDWFGSQCSWSIQEEGNSNNVLYSAPLGTYSDLGVNPNFPQPITQLYTYTFNVNPATCYAVIVNDQGGDGINNTSGAGYYRLKSNNVLVISSNGQYGAGETRLFRTADSLAHPADTTGTTGIANVALHIQSLNLYPNPTSGLTNLAMNLTQGETVGISVINSMGQQVYTSKNNKMDAGFNTVSLNTENWTSGIYFINVSSVSGNVKRKLTVTH